MNPGEQFKIESVEEFEQAREMFKDRWYDNPNDNELVLNNGWEYIVCYKDGAILLDRKRSINKTIPSPLKSKHEVLQEEPYDYVNPEHYKSSNKEVWEMMLELWGKEAFIKHCEMTAFKYRMRLGKKPDQPIERDLEKAKWYENKAIELQNE